MKKTYEAPSVEKIAFQYRDQVVVASGPNCSVTNQRIDSGTECHISDDFPLTYTREG